MTIDVRGLTMTFGRFTALDGAHALDGPRERPDGAAG